MWKILVLCAPLFFFASLARAQESAPVSGEERAEESGERPANEGDGTRAMSGMSVLGNEEAPKSLVIVPWKSSELGADLSLSDTLDDRARPVDREVFLRELDYYELRSGK